MQLELRACKDKLAEIQQDFIIYSSSSKKTDECSGNLHLLSKELVRNEIIRRCNNQSVMAKMIYRNAITDMLGGQLIMEATDVASTSSSLGPTAVKGCCKLCKYHGKKYRKTRRTCLKCNQPVCAPHGSVQYVCKNCD